MSSVEKNIIHDHMYSSNSETEKDCNQATDSLNKNEKSSYSQRRTIRTKHDIQTEDDHQEYFRRRSLNNQSCRISRLHRRSKSDSMIQKCVEYEELNRKLNSQILVMIPVINQLKEHLRTLVSNSIQQN